MFSGNKVTWQFQEQRQTVSAFKWHQRGKYFLWDVEMFSGLDCKYEGGHFVYRSVYAVGRRGGTWNTVSFLHGVHNVSDVWSGEKEPRVGAMKTWWCVYLCVFWLISACKWISCPFINLTNSLTLLGLLFTATTVTSSDQWSTSWKFEWKLWPHWCAFDFPYSTAGPYVTGTVNKVFGTFRLQCGPNKSCADSK